MKGRLSLLGVLLVALFAILLLKTDRVREMPRASSDPGATDVPATIVPREAPQREPQEAPKAPASKVARKSARETRTRPVSSEVRPTQVPESPVTPATEPTLKIDVAPTESAPAGGSRLVLPEVESETGVEDRLPFPWIDQVQQAQPGFVDPNRLDVRNPSGNPILQRPAPTGPGAGFYDPENRFAEEKR